MPIWWIRKCGYAIVYSVYKLFWLELERIRTLDNCLLLSISLPCRVTMVISTRSIGKLYNLMPVLMTTSGDWTKFPKYFISCCISRTRSERKSPLKGSSKKINFYPYSFQNWIVVFIFFCTNTLTLGQWLVFIVCAHFCFNNICPCVWMLNLVYSGGAENVHTLLQHHIINNTAHCFGDLHGMVSKCDLMFCGVAEI